MQSVSAAFESHTLIKAVMSKPDDKKIKKTVVTFFRQRRKYQRKIGNFSDRRQVCFKDFVSRRRRPVHFIGGTGPFPTDRCFCREQNPFAFGFLKGSSSPDRKSQRSRNCGLLRIRRQQKELHPDAGKRQEFSDSSRISDNTGKIHDKKQAKYRQINKFLEQIEAVASSVSDRKKIHLLDLCCGKSYLTFAAHWYFTAVLGKETVTVGVDLKRDVIETCTRIAEKLGMKGLSFKCENVSLYSPDFVPDMVISLHACDIATDYVLASAVKLGAKIILSTPCCQHQLSSDMKGDAPRLYFALSDTQTEFASVATDALRALILEIRGYSVTVCEFTDPEETPKI